MHFLTLSTVHDGQIILPSSSYNNKMFDLKGAPETSLIASTRMLSILQRLE